MNLSSFQVIKKPIVTEKSTLIRTSGNNMAFEVHPKASKTQIKEAIEKIFDVKVEQVRTINSLKQARQGKSRKKKNTMLKKAYVSLAKGDSIEVIEGL